MMQTIDLAVGGARLTGCLHRPSAEMPGRAVRPAMLVLPGGAYRFCSDREAEPVALAWFARGYQAFVLRYSTAAEGEPPLLLRPLGEAAAAVALLRSRAGEWGIDPQKIAVSGFSAGGHLAASLGVHWQDERLRAPGTPAETVRPDALVLGYSVISAQKGLGDGADVSIEVLTGGDAAWMDYFCLEKQADAQTPPTFLWTTYTDTCVFCEHTLRFAGALYRAGVPEELHLFGGFGMHGYALANAETGSELVPADAHLSHWLPLAAEWLDGRFGWRE